jgi:diaminopimelate decarboxylase
MIETRNNILHIGGFAVTGLAQKYPGPLYIYDGDAIEQRFQELKSLLPSWIEVIYSMKANPNASIVALLSAYANGVDVSSRREMQVALRSGFSPSNVFFVGPSKSEEEIEEALQHQIGCLVVESVRELTHASRIAERNGLIARVALRVNPAFDSVGSKLKMGGTARQFGIDEEQIEEVLRISSGLPAVSIIGLHAYVGTRILDWKVAVHNTQEILDLAERVHTRTGLPLELVDVGGGLGVPYFSGEQTFDLHKFAKEVGPVFERFSERLPQTRVVMELGRFLVAEAGVYVTEVRYTKTSRGQKYALVSGGMNHHQATTSIGSMVKTHFPMKILNKMEQPAAESVFVCGPLCTPSDVLARAVELPPVEEGDLIGILKSGAYGMTASPLEFLSHSWPREVLVFKNADYLIRRPPDVDEILRYQPLAPLNSCAVA